MGPGVDLCGLVEPGVGLIQGGPVSGGDQIHHRPNWAPPPETPTPVKTETGHWGLPVSSPRESERVGSTDIQVGSVYTASSVRGVVVPAARAVRRTQSGTDGWSDHWD